MQVGDNLNVRSIRQPGGSIKHLARESTFDAKRPRDGVKLERRFTAPGDDVWSTVEWAERTASIGDGAGSTVFEQKGIEVPERWSQLAVNVVASKYFRGHLHTPQRERSVKQLIGRVAETIYKWGKADGYFHSDEDAETFKSELTYLLLHQMYAFNSPVWFNVGIDPHPQCSACFINSVDDTMESILELAKTEARLFKGGSGTGSNLSAIRSSQEKLTGGGTASGPVSFMRGFDAFAGVIKCVTADTLVWTETQGGVPIIEAEGRIATGKGFAPIAEFHENVPKPVTEVELGFTGLSLRGTDNHPVLTLGPDGLAWKNLGELEEGDAIAVANNHWPASLSDAPIKYTSTINEAYRKKQYTLPTHMSPDLGLLLGLLCAEGSIDETRVRFINGDEDTVTTFVDAWERVFGHRLKAHHNTKKNAFELSSHAIDIVRLLRHLGLSSPSSTKQVPSLIFRSSRATAEAFLRGYFDGDGHNGRTIFAVSASKKLRDQLQQLLLALGYVSCAYTTSHGYFGVRLGGDMAARYREKIGFISHRKRNWHQSTPAEDRNTNIDVIPGLVSAVRSRSLGSGWFQTKDGEKKRLSFGFFNRTSDNVSITWLREHPETVMNLAEVAPGWHEAVITTIEHGYFWDRVAKRTQGEVEATFDITVPGEHSFIGNGIVCHNSGGKTRRAAKMVILNCDHPDIEEFVESKSKEEKKAWALIEQGYDGTFTGEAYQSVFFQNANHSMRATDDFMRAAVENRDWDLISVCEGKPLKTIKARKLLMKAAEATHVCGDPGIQYDTTINLWHTCKNTSPINGSNPCSEFMFLDDTACNLGSLNLLKFMDENGEFRVDDFRHACEITILAQEILVDNSSYPTASIAQNSHDYRPLGLGYANLGAALMSRGVPYDSEEGRAYTAAITSIMCGHAYATSARIAQARGTFSGYPKNREPFLGVMNMHRDHAYAISDTMVPQDMLDAARSVWDDAINVGQEHGFRNAQVTVLAPTGTIAFMMDCDTTGIEPDIALIKFKRLVGGGILKIVNHTVPLALTRLGYSDKESTEILEYIEAEETIEGAPGLKDEHLPVFDCAFRAQKGSRSISPMGHIKMMAAAQPFLSGAISKTVNVPEDASVEDIYDMYVQGWRLGLKAIAVYRDGSKRSQPLATDKKAQSGSGKVAEAEVQPEARPARRNLPVERAALTHKFAVGGHEGFLTVGLFEDGTPGELFITMSKEGSTISGLMDTIAKSVSLALQYGVPLKVLVDQFSHMRFEPAGFTGNPNIPIAKSVVDYIFRWLGQKFSRDEEHVDSTMSVQAEQILAKVLHTTHPQMQLPMPAYVPPPSPTTEAQQQEIFRTQADAPPCHVCGTITIRAGACYACPNCGATTGCG